MIKGILCLLAKQNPKSFDNDLDVILDNSWLKIASSKNYHHFFPKVWFKTDYKECEYFYINHIANITIVDGYLNKHKIGGKSPSKYINEFANKNNNIINTLATHLICMDSDGINDNNYDVFYDNRCKHIADKLSEFIIEQEHGTTALEVYADNAVEEID